MQEWTGLVNRGSWALGGPWVGEADFRAFVEPSTGIQCLVVRTGMGHLCGYVGIPTWHPWHNDSGLHCVDVHGGVTYTSTDYPVPTGWPVTALPVVVPGLWWVGFDTAHAGDQIPYMQRGFPGATYRDIDYVTQGCRRLTWQAWRELYGAEPEPPEEND